MGGATLVSNGIVFGWALIVYALTAPFDETVDDDD